MKTKGWKQVFAFTFTQQVKTKSFIVSTIIISLIVALMAFTADFLPAVLLSDKFDEANSSGSGAESIIKLDEVFICNTTGDDLGLSELFQTFGVNCTEIAESDIDARINDIKNVTFYQNDATIFMQQMAASGDKVDLVFMDPPRSGSTPEFIKAVQTLSPSKVVYISCSPDSLANDLKIFEKSGYKVKRAVPVDMFPFTRGIETCCLLERLTQP